MATRTDIEAARLIDSIKSAIIVGQLRPREHLVEDEISVRYQASRHIVRAALVELERMGLIVRRPNRGAIVRDFSVEQVEQIYDVRRLLQRDAARQLPLPAAPEVVEEISQIHAEYCRELEAGNLLQVNALNDRFHRCIWATCPNRYLAQLIDRLWIETTGIRWYGVGNPELLAHSREHHATMIVQLRDGAREDFVNMTAEHIMPPLEAFRRAHRVELPQPPQKQA